MAHPTTEAEDAAAAAGVTPHRSESRETADTDRDDDEDQLELDDADEIAGAGLDKHLKDKRTRFDLDERRPEGASALTDTMSSDATFVPVMEDNQAANNASAIDLRYMLLERKLERMEKRLEAYEGLQRRQAKSKTRYHESDGEGERGGGGGGGSADTHQLIEFFLTEMDKQNKVIAEMRAAQRDLERKLELSMRKTNKFHHDQLDRMTKFQEVVQMMNSEFLHGAMLRDEEKALEKTSQDKKTKAVRRALDEQIQDLKTETSHQRRRLEIKFERKIVELASENQQLKAENLELRDEVVKLGMAARSTKRTVRILSDEVIKLKRAVGSAPNHEVEELLRVGGGGGSTFLDSTSIAEVHPPRDKF